MKNSENIPGVPVRGRLKDLLDSDGDGKIGISDVMTAALSLPGVKIDRAGFLQKELSKVFPPRTVEKAVRSTPALAGITTRQISKVADEVIKFERKTVSGLSAALGVPGGATVVVTAPANIIQYYACTLRAAQKLMYLYGFPQLGFSKGEELDGTNPVDRQTINLLTLMLGAMHGAGQAKRAVRILARGFAGGAERGVVGQALTKGALYPIVRSTVRRFGVTMTKDLFREYLRKSIPVIGRGISGGITWLAFKPACNRLKKALEDTPLANPRLTEADDGEPISIINRESDTP